jgi:hypothetical protein
MLPKTNNKHGGTLGRAVSGAGDRRDIVRAGDLRAIRVCLASIVFTGCTLAFSAPGLWPALFSQ